LSHHLTANFTDRSIAHSTAHCTAHCIARCTAHCTVLITSLITILLTVLPLIVLIIYLLTPSIKSTFLWLWGVKPKMKTTPNDMTSISILVTIVQHTLSMCHGANVDSSSVLYSSSFHPLFISQSAMRRRSTSESLHE
jgi:hypothetical protein